MNTNTVDTIIVEWISNQSTKFGNTKRGELTELPKEDAKLFCYRGLCVIPESVIITYKGSRSNFTHKWAMKNYVFQKGVPRTLPVKVVRELMIHKQSFEFASTGKIIILRKSIENRSIVKRNRDVRKIRDEMKEREKDPMKHFSIKYQGNLGDVLRATCLAEALYYLGHTTSFRVKVGMEELFINNPFITKRPVLADKTLVVEEVDLDNVRVHKGEGKNVLRTHTWLEALGLYDSTYRRPSYFPTDEEIEWAKGEIDPKKFIVALGTKASVKGKTWTGFKELTRRLKDEDTDVIILDEMVLVESMKMDYKHTIRQAASLISQSDMLITNDSLHLHLAGAMDKSCICIFGNTNGEVMAQDYPFVKPIQGECDRGPCWYNMSCKKDYHIDTLPCIESITVERVLKEVEKIRC